MRTSAHARIRRRRKPQILYTLHGYETGSRPVLSLNIKSVSDVTLVVLYALDAYWRPSFFLLFHKEAVLPRLGK